MKMRALILLLSAALLVTACSSHSQPALPSDASQNRSNAPSAAEPLAPGTQRVVFKFRGTATGNGPGGALVALRGVLYGTTVGGSAPGSVGTVFAINPSTGKERVIYNFKGGSDGASPNGSLVALNGLLYGTSPAGGGHGCSNQGCGTVFSIDPSTGSERVLHRFAFNDGTRPAQGLVVANGILYGTAPFGGTNKKSCRLGCGTVFSVDPSSSNFAVVHAFSDSPDGYAPEASLLDVNGSLYGTTLYGGDVTYCSDRISCGTVFAFDIASGLERIVYSFHGAIDGAAPLGSLTFARGRLYGTTSSGGLTYCFSDESCGTVFSIVLRTGEERVLYRFTGSDGSSPQSALVAADGVLYGTTPYGGGAGTVFSIDMSNRAERIVYAFPVRADSKATRGGSPTGGLVAFGGKLYGTTSSGGSYTCGSERDDGCGTIYSITP